MNEDKSKLGRLLRDPSGPLDRGTDWLGDSAADLVEVLPTVAIATVTALIVGFALRRFRDRRVGRGARLLTIGVPPEVDPGGATLLWSTLHDLLRPPLARLVAGQPHLAWEMAADSAGTAFRLWVPHSVPPGLAERAVLSTWPGATVTEIEPTHGTSAQRVVVATELVLSGPEWFALGGRNGADPLQLVLGQLAGTDEAERAVVQILARPASAREQHRLHRAARHLRLGVSPRRLGRLLDAANSRPPRRPGQDPTVNPDVRAVLEKASEPLYRCLVRIVVTAPRRGPARGRIHGIASAFAAYEGRVGLRRRRVRAPRAKLSDRRIGRGAFLASVEELAALAHLPTAEAIPGLVRAGARSVASPPGLAADGKPLGLASNGKPVALGVADGRHHVHLLGPTGVGKSTLIARMALADLAAGRGAVVIDPKGDLVEDILDRIPDGREDQVELLDPLDSSPPGLNVLDGQDKDLVVDQLVGIFHRIFERFWGPRTDDILRAALLTLTRLPDATLADVPRLLTDADWRAPIVSQIEDPAGLEPFWSWYDALPETTRAQATGPVLNKLRAFLLRRHVRAIVGQQRSTLDLGHCLDHGRLLLVRVPKGILGEDTSRLLGSFVVARIWQAALARAARPPEDRPDAALYVDEVHNYLTLPTALEDLLAEARSYRLSLLLAHQHLAQLRRDIREGIAANARTKVYFQLSPDDAAALDRDVRPQLRAHDLAHLQRHTAAVRVCREGDTSAAFTISTCALSEPIPGRAETVRETVRQRYGTTREQVEARLGTRHPPPARLHRRVREQPQVRKAISSPTSPPICPPISPPTKTGGPPNRAEPQSRAEAADPMSTRQGGHERK